MTTDDNNIVRLEGTEWYAAEDLARRLDVSVRTIYRRLERGKIEKRETPRGTVYRVRSDDPTDTASLTSDDKAADTKFGEAVLRLVDQVAGQSERIAELTAKASKLEARLEAALEDRERLLRYVDQTEERMDELLEELDQLDSELMQSRARVYLETGRREMADERLQDARDRAERLEDERERLEDERERLERRLEAEEAANKKGWTPFG